MGGQLDAPTSLSFLTSEQEVGWSPEAVLRREIFLLSARSLIEGLSFTDARLRQTRLQMSFSEIKETGEITTANS